MIFAPYSFSKINTWKTCPRQFKYRYIDKLPTQPRDMTALLKGSAVHSILENYPDPGTHKLSTQYADVAQKFLDSHYVKLFSYPNIRELAVGISHDLEPVEYSKTSMFRGYIDYITVIYEEMEIEVDSLDDIPEGFELVEIINKL
jgi:hypothetical protein